MSVSLFRRPLATPPASAEELRNQQLVTEPGHSSSPATGTPASHPLTAQFNRSIGQVSPSYCTVTPPAWQSPQIP